MAAPQFVPQDPVERPRVYASPDHVPEAWMADRPAEIDGRQPEGGRMGYQGPDQGYAIVLANRFRDRLLLQDGERDDDVVTGCLGVALKRASLFGRAPVIHDLTIAFTIWGYLDLAPPAELVELRRPLFAGVQDTSHHYLEWRAIADSVPEATLRQSHTQVREAYPARWRELLGR